MPELEKTYRIAPAKAGVYMFLWGIVIFMLVIYLVTFLNAGFETASLAVAVAVLVIVGGIMGFFSYQAKNAAFTVSAAGLKVGPGLYGRLISWDKIDTSGVRLINLNLEKQYQAKWRLNGAGLPGYAAGWFKLYNKEKALLFVTEASNVVYIPTKENYAVMLSPQEADDMVRQIWKRSGQSAK